MIVDTLVLFLLAHWRLCARAPDILMISNASAHGKIVADHGPSPGTDRIAGSNNQQAGGFHANRRRSLSVADLKKSSSEGTKRLLGAAAFVALEYPLVGLGICVCCLIVYLRPDPPGAGSANAAFGAGPLTNWKGANRLGRSDTAKLDAAGHLQPRWRDGTAAPDPVTISGLASGPTLPHLSC